ncbi:hypothetical protein E2C01_017903 [Portunus trituberculatus]|uniref:Uncharacterized protein n=1 Tax=Portunus trituberculatus TaxID=210409 RepID=A0A5B7DUT0_PORTR|nr:hypothetical protein [Portunus trituberculatus]
MFRPKEGRGRVGNCQISGAASLGTILIRPIFVTATAYNKASGTYDLATLFQPGHVDRQSDATALPRRDRDSVAHPNRGGQEVSASNQEDV